MTPGALQSLRKPTGHDLLEGKARLLLLRGQLDVVCQTQDLQRPDYHPRHVDLRATEKRLEREQRTEREKYLMSKASWHKLVMLRTRKQQYFERDGASAVA